jgi:glycosyltransferase involved in cell wall biosynthesis
MLLSIVMMMKNEERYLDKTLKALESLMKDIDSELIVLDTGSDDSSVEIAKKYTDKVYFAKWNNNFAHMRNISISYASGDWILILDADEELTNYDKLKNFFNKDLSNKYNSASISLKNFHSNDKKVYSIAPIIRLFKNYKGFGYEGAIHEQPLFKGPVYNDIATFNHYGYLFEDEEIKQLKDNRNKKILLDEISKQPNNPYMNYQLGKNYVISRDYEDALYYMEKAYNLYNKINYIPIFVTLDLASLYIDLSEFEKCEKLCLKYIKVDNKNIDIYYYLATSQKQLSKFKQSIENYNRYLYLIENYDISTQANNSECNFDTLIHKEKCEVNIIDNYYKLELYEDVIKDLNNISINVLEEAYLVIFMSLYKLKKEEKIIELYNKVSGSVVQKNKFKIALEAILNRIKENDRPKIYELLCNMDGNYGVLNEIRLGKNVNKEKYNEILRNEKEVYYGEILYYALKNGINIENVLKGINYLNIQKYMDYLVKNKRDCIIELYSYLENVSNTLELKKIQIYSCLAKSLLMYGNLVNEKYETLFLMYISYAYECVKYVYNESLTDEEILNFLRNEEDEFVVSMNVIDKLKNTDKLAYIRELKSLLMNNPQHKKGIQVLISKFEYELNQSSELKELKKKYKSLIESSINCGNLNEALDMIKEYESMFSEEAEILNMKSIIALLSNNLVDAESLLRKSWILEKNNFNTIFNIAYLKELLGDKEEVIRFYNKILISCDDECIVADAKDKISLILQN